MQFVDLHCDTLSKLLKNPSLGTLAENRLSVDFKRMMQSGSLLQVFASFIKFADYPFENPAEAGWEDALKMNDLFYRDAEAYGMINVIRSRKDLEQIGKDGKLNALLSVEEGGILNNNPERLKMLYERGIRLITLTWNFDNCLGSPNSEDWEIMEEGLKPFGKEMVEAMGEKGMLVDVSHLSDGGFMDVAAIVDGPFVASHSNARALCPHQRNLTDEMLHIIGDHGGVAGLNFYPRFLEEDQEESTVSAMVKHVMYMVDKAGIESVALGSDLDGITGKLEIGSVDQIPKLAEALKQAGMTNEMIEKIFRKNALRVMRDVLR